MLAYRITDSGALAWEADAVSGTDVEALFRPTALGDREERTDAEAVSGAADEGYIELNPAQSLRKHLRKREGEAHEPDPLSADEMRRLVDTTRAQFSRWTAFVLCGLRTGLRLSELIGLDWSDLDDAGTLTVQRAVVRGVIGTPKNHQRRVVDVSPELLTALRVYRRALRAFALKKGRSAPTVMFPAVGGVERLDEATSARCSLAFARPQRCGSGRLMTCAIHTRPNCCRRMRRCST